MLDRVDVHFIDYLNKIASGEVNLSLQKLQITTPKEFPNNSKIPII